MSTGSVKSSISLYKYKTRNLSLPITMDYSADGFKVDQVASRVGTGWTLNAGGAVSRTVLGNPDGGGYVDLFLKDLGNRQKLIDNRND
ncbi:hypothetical protein [Pedobacter sp. KBS0701]|uniref:hypothetical protein n=1 Tax=Pedobacter sp. KBS0701 TaxID=2578106 RepID=UPI001AF01944|nr:hypothetical protein [Pedobacter sp. KBS0701]